MTTPNHQPASTELHSWGCRAVLMIGPCNCHLSRNPTPTVPAKGDACRTCGAKRPGWCVEGIYIPVCQHDSVDGFTDNQKGGDSPCSTTALNTDGQQKDSHVPNADPVSTVASNAPAAVQSHSQGQELPSYFVVAHDPETYDTYECTDLIEGFKKAMWIDSEYVDGEEVEAFRIYAADLDNWYINYDDKPAILEWNMDGEGAGTIKFYLITRK